MSVGCIACGYDASAAVVASWSFFVPLDSKSLNSGLTNGGGTRFAYKRIRDEWYLRIRSAVNAMHSSRLQAADSFRRVTITRCYDGRQQLRDDDNYVGGCKPVRDSLIRCGVIVDDNAANAQVIYKQLRQSPTGLRFVVEELIA